MVCVVRLWLPSAWTAEEDARLERLAKENGFRHWHRVARQMPGRSHGLCRDRWRHHLARHVYHRAFTAGDDAELARLHRRHGGRWKNISRAIYGRTSGVLKKRWKEIRRRDAAKNGAKKASFCCPAPAMPDVDENLEMEPEPSFPAAAAPASRRSCRRFEFVHPWLRHDDGSQGRQPRVRVLVHGSMIEPEKRRVSS